jgi:hypothetical protein
MLRNLKNLNKFKAFSVLTSALYFYLFVSLLLFPESICEDFGIIDSELIYILARRASTLMLGFSVLLFLIKNAPPSVVRQAVAFSISLNMAGFALMGSFELIRGFAKMSILSAIVVEILVAATYFSFWVSDKRRLKQLNS